MLTAPIVSLGQDLRLMFLLVSRRPPICAAASAVTSNTHDVIEMFNHIGSACMCVVPKRIAASSSHLSRQASGWQLSRPAIDDYGRRTHGSSINKSPQNV